MNLETQPIAFSQAIQHLGTDSILDSASISNTTQQLEARTDSIVASFNELLTELANTPQLIPVVFPIVTLSTNMTVQLGNFRIPKGYKASVLNAIVSSSPASGKVTFNIFASAGTYGQSGSGQGVTQLVSTVSEYNGSGQFVPTGELIFQVSSSATQRTAVTVSALLVLQAVPAS